MQACEIPSRDLLPANIIHLEIKDKECDLDCAMLAAIDQAEELDNSPKLLGWYDKKDQTYFPKGECCLDGEPTWLAFSEGQGADLTIDVNDEEYVFLFRKSHGLP